MSSNIIDLALYAIEKKVRYKMGAFDDVTTIILPDPGDPVAAEAFRRKWKWDPHEQVTLRGVYTAADAEVVGNASTLTEKGSFTLQPGTGRIKLMEQMIVGWTFSRNGQPVPVSLRTIKSLPFNYMTPILEVCDKLAQTMSEEEQEDFLNGANGHTSVDTGSMSLSRVN